MRKTPVTSLPVAQTAQTDIAQEKVVQSGNGVKTLQTSNDKRIEDSRKEVVVPDDLSELVDLANDIIRRGRSGRN